MRIAWQKENCRCSEGCTACAQACAKRALNVSREGVSVCSQCNPKYAACITACGKRALIANNAGTIVLAVNRCDGCGECVAACAHGMRMESGKAAKCDLCGNAGTPACVKACAAGALALDEPSFGEVDVEYRSPKSARSEDARKPARQTAPMPHAGARAEFVGDGRRIPAVRGGGDAAGGKGGKFGDFSFRTLPLPKAKRAEVLEVKEGLRIVRIDGVNIYLIESHPFSPSEWEAGRKARYFAIREAATELFLHEGDAYFDRAKRAERLEAATARAQRILGETAVDMDEGRQREMARFIAADCAGFGAIDLIWLSSGGELEEIEVNHPLREITVYHRRYGRCLTNLVFTGERGFRRVMNSIVHPLGFSLDDAHPSVDAQLPDGSRLHAQVYPLALSGASANIRFSPSEFWTLPRLVAHGMLGAQAAAFLWLALDTRRSSIVVTGPPAAGKTSFLSALLALLPRGERVISIEEDINELRLDDSRIDWVPLRGVHEEKKDAAVRANSGRWTARSVLDQVANALRMRPDRLVLGEMRGPEAQRVFSGANLGIPFAATMHSNERGAAVLKRLHSPPMGVRAEALSALDLVVSVGFDASKARRVMEVSEVHWSSRGHDLPNGKALDGGGCTEQWKAGDEQAFVKAVFSHGSVASDRKCGKSCAGESRTLGEYCRVFGLSPEDGQKELEKRARIIGELASAGRASHSPIGAQSGDASGACCR